MIEARPASAGRRTAPADARLGTGRWRALWVAALLAMAGCDEADTQTGAGADAGPDVAAEACALAPWPASAALPVPANPDPVDVRAARGVLYELQARTANACHPEVGSAEQRAACAARTAPQVEYRAEGLACGELASLEAIRLGTLDDLVEDTADYGQGVTLRYIDERVGADLVWLMPIFPNNDAVAIPDGCDNLGSPYASRDYFHVAGTLSRECIAVGRDEYSAEPCWGDDALDAFLDEAEARGQHVLLDVAFNHFGHRYVAYDVAGWEEPEAWTMDALADHDATFDEALVWPTVLDDPARLEDLDGDAARLLADLDARCPGLEGQARVRAFHAWRLAFAEERATFPCDDERLEARVPAFYLGADARRPAASPADGYVQQWRDVRFLFHRLDDPRYERHALRVREYVFRAMNLWMARGVDGFRLDHATDSASGIRGPHWEYILSKLAYYAALRGQAPPLILAEEFHHQDEMAGLADTMTEGYLFDMAGRGGVTKNVAHVERALARADRFGGRTLVMAALENHDELRLTDGTGFNAFTGAGFWALGAASATTPMLLVGQERGEERRLSFKRSDFLRSRFDGAGFRDGLAAFYAELIAFRRSDEGAALRGAGRRFLRTPEGAALDGVVAMLRWDADANVLLAVHNLWETGRSVEIAIPNDVAAGVLGPDPCAPLRLVDRLSGLPLTSCRPAEELARGMRFWMGPADRLYWAAFEACEPG